MTAFLQGIFTRDIPVIIPDYGHVGIDVAGGLDGGAESADFAPVVQKTDYNRYAGTVGNVIETRLPIEHALAGSRGRHHENQVVALAEFRDGLGHQVVRAGPIDGQRPQPAEKWPQRPAEPGVFHHDDGIEAVDEGQAERVDEIPV